MFSLQRKVNAALLKKHWDVAFIPCSSETLETHKFVQMFYSLWFSLPKSSDPRSVVIIDVLDDGRLTG